jgi:hypothetical protein
VASHGSHFVMVVGGRVDVEVIVAVSMIVVLEKMTCVMMRGGQSIVTVTVGHGSETGDTGSVGVVSGVVVGSDSGGTGSVGVVSGVVTGSERGGTGRVGVVTDSESGGAGRVGVVSGVVAGSESGGKGT